MANLIQPPHDAVLFKSDYFDRDQLFQQQQLKRSIFYASLVICGRICHSTSTQLIQYRNYQLTKYTQSRFISKMKNSTE